MDQSRLPNLFQTTVNVTMLPHEEFVVDEVCTTKDRMQHAAKKHVSWQTFPNKVVL
ncbi:hypothetical protein IWQ51_005908 [Labrenzia sp. EL_142]|nr:hypothetical protein [Labrenzia sp. EL_142]MBG6210964.1 hypothetical protein [Labrenzia sp. EL_126]